MRIKEPQGISQSERERKPWYEESPKEKTPTKLRVRNRKGVLQPHSSTASLKPTQGETEYQKQLRKMI